MQSPRLFAVAVVLATRPRLSPEDPTPGSIAAPVAPHWRQPVGGRQHRRVFGSRAKKQGEEDRGAAPALATRQVSNRPLNTDSKSLFRTMADQVEEPLDVVIVGGGIAGLCAALALLDAGVDRLVVLEVCRASSIPVAPPSLPVHPLNSLALML